MTIIGKSKAAIAMILDALPPGIFEIKVFNNQNIEGKITANKILIKEYAVLPQDFQFCLGAVMPETKKKIVEKYILPYQTLINKSAFVSANSTVNRGSMIDSNASIASGVILGKYVTLYANCSVAHDSILGDFVTVCPNASLCGSVNIGEGTFIGAGATIKNDVTIGKWCVIGAGSVVLEDVKDGETVYGVPAKSKEELVY